MQTKPNTEYVNQSLVNQIAELSMRIAERDAVITEQYNQINELKEELKELRTKEINKLNNEITEEQPVK